jgi:hypothetical protein
MSGRLRKLMRVGPRHRVDRKFSKVLCEAQPLLSESSVKCTRHPMAPLHFYKKKRMVSLVEVKGGAILVDACSTN